MTKGKLAIAAVALALSACSTDLKVSPLQPGTSQPSVGVPYSLPFARYKVSVTRTFKSCTIISNKPEFAFDLSFNARQLFEPDPKQTFAIDTTSLSSWFKSSEFSWESFQNGMLKKVGIAAQDHTGEVLANALTGAIKIAQTALVTAAGAQQAPHITCDPALIAKRNSLQQLKNNVDAAKERLEADVGKLKTMSDTIATFGKAPMDAIQRETFDQAKQVALSNERLTAAAKALAEALEALSLVDTFVWPDDGQTVVGKHDFDANRFKAWLKHDTAAEKKAISEIVLTNQSVVQLRILPLSRLSLVPREKIESSSTDTPEVIPESALGAELEGIRFRRAVQGVLQVRACNNAVAGDEFCPKGSDSKSTLLAEGPVPQLGRLMVIPFHNGPFQDNALDLGFAEDGTLASGKYQERSARAASATGAVSDAAGTVAQAAKDLPLVKTQTRAAELEAKSKELQAKKKFEDDKIALEPTGFEANDAEIAILKSDTSLLEAKAAKIKAESTLNELSKGTADK